MRRRSRSKGLRPLPAFEALCDYAKGLELKVEVWTTPGTGHLAVAATDGASGYTAELAAGVDGLDDAAGHVLAKLRRETLA